MGFGNIPFELKFIFHPSVRGNLSNFGKIDVMFERGGVWEDLFGVMRVGVRGN